MKKLTVSLILCLLSAALFAQTHKLETVLYDNLETVYLSYWNPVEDTQDTVPNQFSLWGFRKYGESWTENVYEVEYFKGSASEMFDFLTKVKDFAFRYKDEEVAVTYLYGVQVKSFRQKWLGIVSTRTLVYDRERKVPCMFSAKRWGEILEKFVGYCEQKNITL